jgi:hypothetical protein
MSGLRGLFGTGLAAIGSLPPCGGGMGWGVFDARNVTPLPARALNARADLPHKGGGNESQRRARRASARDG